MNIHAPEIFDVSSLRQARAIILTPEDTTTDERWELETPYLSGLAIKNLKITSEDVVLDYGCGVGRIAKELIERTGCRVVGIDTSSSMRALAASYVESPKFFACAPEALSLLPKFNKVLAVWVFQHILNLPEVLENLNQHMLPGSNLVIVNNLRRAIPMRNAGWIDDGVDVSVELEKIFFAETNKIHLKSEIIGPGLSTNTYWRLFRKQETTYG